MGLAENLVQGFAGAAGANDVVGRIQQKKDQQKQMSQEELRDQSNQVFNDIQRIQQRRSQLDPKSTSYSKDLAGVDADLQQAQETFHDLYHPAKNPGALQHLGGFIRAHVPLWKGQGQPPPTTAGAAKQSIQQRLAGVNAAAGAPVAQPNPILQKRQQMKEAGFTDEQIKHVEGIDAGLQPKSADKPLMKPYRINGTVAYYDANHPENIPPGASAVVAGGAVKPLKFDTTTDEVVDQNTGQRYKRGQQDNPPEVAEMFGGQTVAENRKQKNAEHLANVRGASYAANRIIPVVDPSNPEAVVFMPAGKAANSGAQSPSSISFQIDKAVTKAFVAGKPADTINYFTTATDHLKLLQDTAEALHNGDTPLFNKWANKYATETGGEAPTDFDTVRAAVAGELSKTFKGSGATDQEISMIDHTINSSQSPEQLRGAISYYTSLMQGKMDALKGQYTAAKKGQPNFPKTPGEAKDAIKNPSGGVEAFSVNGQIYDIPADKVAAFKKKYPNAQAQ